MPFEIPNGMIEVEQKDFFAFLRLDARDIMPTVREPLFTIWEDRNRNEFGRSFPGWKNPGEGARRYAIRQDLIVSLCGEQSEKNS